MTQDVAQQPLTGLARIESKIDTGRIAETALSSSSGGLAFHNLSEVLEVAKLMALADVAVPKHLRANPGACLAITIQAVEWNFSPFAVANKSYSVNDRMAYEAQLVHAVILARAPIKGRPKHEYTGDGDKRKLRVWAETSDGEIVDYTSPELGRITPKNSPLWKADPDQQLHYSAVRAWCRRHFPDVILGVYTKDEMEDSPGSFRDVTPQPTGLAARLKGEPQGGFNPAGVAEALGDGEGSPDPARGASAASAASDEIVDRDGTALKSKSVNHDPEMVRAGAQAAIDGEVREAPDDLSAADGAAWMHGYDQVRAGQEGGSA